MRVRTGQGLPEDLALAGRPLLINKVESKPPPATFGHTRPDLVQRITGNATSHAYEAIYDFSLTVNQRRKVWEIPGTVSACRS